MRRRTIQHPFVCHYFSLQTTSGSWPTLQFCPSLHPSVLPPLSSLTPLRPSPSVPFSIYSPPPPLLSVKKTMPDSVHVLIAKWQTRDSFRLLKAKARCVQIYLVLCLSALLPLIQYALFEPHRASLLSKTTSNGTIQSEKRPHRKKGLAVACFGFYYFIIHVKTLTGSLFSSCVAAISAFDTCCLIQNETQLISEYSSIFAHCSLPAVRG